MKQGPVKGLKKARVKRIPDRGVYDRDEINEFLKNEFLCHVGFNYNNYPVVIPTLFGWKEDAIYIHGASVSRLITELEKKIDVCISIAHVSGMVLARSAFHHSMNYESVVIFGKGELVKDEEKEAALKIISDHILPGRWEEVRRPNKKELKATRVIRVSIEEISGKRRTGGPKDEKEDMDLEVWAGVLPFINSFGKPVRDSILNEKIELPGSLYRKIKDHN